MRLPLGSCRPVAKGKTPQKLRNVALCPYRRKFHNENYLLFFLFFCIHINAIILRNQIFMDQRTKVSHFNQSRLRDHFSFSVKRSMMKDHPPYLKKSIFRRSRTCEIKNFFPFRSLPTSNFRVYFRAVLTTLCCLGNLECGLGNLKVCSTFMKLKLCNFFHSVWCPKNSKVTASSNRKKCY